MFIVKNKNKHLILNISNEKFVEIIRQSIPEKNPILYRETSLKLL